MNLIYLLEDDNQIINTLSEYINTDTYKICGVGNPNPGSIRNARLNNANLIISNINILKHFESPLHYEKLFSPPSLPIIFISRPEELTTLSSIQVEKYFGIINIPLQELQVKNCISLALHRIQIEKKLEETDERYKFLFQKNQEVMLLIDPYLGEIIDANRKACNFFGLSHADILFKNIQDLTPLAGDDFLEQIRNVNKEKANELVFQHLSSKGELLNIEVYADTMVLDNRKMIFAIFHDISEKSKNIELAVKQHEMLRSTISSIDDLVFALNNDAHFIEYYQPIDSPHFSISSDLFIGKSVFEVGFPDDVAKKYEDAIKKVRSSGNTEQIEYFLEAFGSKLWYNARISPRKNSFNSIEGVTVVCRDVTKQKKAEESITKARDFYLTLLNDFPTLIWKSNPSKKLDYFNKTWIDFTGRTLEEELKKDWIEKIHFDDITAFLSTFLDAYKNKKFFQIEHRLKHHSGEYRWIFNLGRPFFDLDGNFSGFIGSCYDITERKKAEELLRLQKSAMESAIEGIVILDANISDFPIIYANQEMENLLKYPVPNLVGKDFISLFNGHLDPINEEKIRKALYLKTSFRGEIKIQDSLGKSLWLHVLISPVADQKKSASHFVSLVNNITESKESEEMMKEKNRQLEKTNAELDRFVYSTSHELRSPLMSVLGLISLLEMESEPDEQKNYIQMMKESITKLDTIIHDIIDYSRNNRMELVYEEIDLETIINESFYNLKYMEGSSRIRLNTEIKAKCPFFSDKRRMTILINNFISNCIKYHNYNQPDPFVEISIKISPLNAIISIKDNGLGIAEKHLEKIYDMFFRATEKSSGSGIGLYIVKEIVEKLTGLIDVQSIEGKGTLFTVEIPNNIPPLEN